MTRTRTFLIALTAVGLASVSVAAAQGEPAVSCDLGTMDDGRRVSICFELEPTPEPTPVPPTPTPEPTAEPTPEPTPTPVPDGVLFVEDFSDPDSLDRFDTQVYHGVPSSGTPDTWLGDHDENCGPPGTTRTINNPFTEQVDGPPISSDVGNTIYWCAPAPGLEHIMTSFDTKGYAHLDFAPSQSFVDVGRVCWAQNMNDLGRKWTQVTIVSEARFQANGERLDWIRPTLDGPGDRGVQLAGDDFMFMMREGSPSTFVGQTLFDPARNFFRTTDKARRWQTCFEDLGNGAIRVELERSSGTVVRFLDGAIPDGEVRVMFGDASYNNTKDNANVPNPFTIHWDDITIESS